PDAQPQCASFRCAFLDPRFSPAVAPHRQRPAGSCRRRAADEHDELTALHSSTRSARAMTVGGTVMPSPLATVRLMLSSNVVGCCIGRAEGFAPLRNLATWDAAPPVISATFCPFV